MKYPIESGNPMKQSKLTRTVNLVEAWVEATIHDESIGYEEAFERVMAKIQAKTSETKRQHLSIIGDKFRVITTYTNAKAEATGSISGEPHVEVTEHGIKIGCIRISNEAIYQMNSLLWKRIRLGGKNFVEQTGYMPK
jgi:hypothetical protein